MPRVAQVDAFWEQPLAAPLAPARKCGATAFSPHPSTETVLAFPRSLGWLIGAFHKTGKSLNRSESGYSRGKPGIVNATTLPLSVRERGDQKVGLFGNANKEQARFTKLPTRRIFGITSRNQWPKKKIL